jgi:hypothetical protein
VIKQELGGGIETLERTVNGYTLTFAVLLLTGAAFGNRLGRRRMVVVGIALFTLGSAAAALAPSIELLIAARAFQGIGGAIVTPPTLTILSDAVPPEEARARARCLGRHRRPRHRARPPGGRCRDRGKQTLGRSVTSQIYLQIAVSASIAEAEDPRLSPRNHAGSRTQSGLSD